MLMILCLIDCLLPGDYHSFDIDGSAGQFMRFYGNQCRHYTMDNTTEMTRISFDFRVIPACYFADMEEVVRLSTSSVESPGLDKTFHGSEEVRRAQQTGTSLKRYVPCAQ
jgi:hypothetical protein